MLEDDDRHPIASVNRLDLVAQRRTGGAELVILIAQPLQADEQSKQRLMTKIENYLGFILSDEFAQEFGPPDPSTAAIRVKIHKDSDPIIFDILQRCGPWANDNKASLVVDAGLG